jgi:hypothetical protein
MLCHTRLSQNAPLGVSFWESGFAFPETNPNIVRVLGKAHAFCAAMHNASLYRNILLIFCQVILRENL